MFSKTSTPPAFIRATANSLRSRATPKSAKRLPQSCGSWGTMPAINRAKMRPPENRGPKKGETFKSQFYLGLERRRLLSAEVARLAVMGLSCSQIREKMERPNGKMLALDTVRRILRDPKTQAKIKRLSEARDGDAGSIRKNRKST